MPVSSSPARKRPSIKPTVGKFCTPEKPSRIRSSRNTSMWRNGSVPHTPARTGVWATTGRTSRAISTHDAVGVAIGHHAGERAAAGHAVAAGIVDHDQIGAAVFLAFGRNAGAGAGADDRLAARFHGAEAGEDVGARDAGHGRSSLRAPARDAAAHQAAEFGGDFGGKLRVVDVHKARGRGAASRSAAPWFRARGTIRHRRSDRRTAGPARRARKPRLPGGRSGRDRPSD